MTTIEALVHASSRIETMVDEGEISAGHVTICPAAARFTLFLADEQEECLMHVQYDVAWEQLEQFRNGPDALCDLVLDALVRKLHGEDVADPCSG